MSLLIKSGNKAPLSKLQQTFNGLIKKIENLQQSIKITDAKLGEGLCYYHANIRPIEQKKLEKLTECVKLFYSFLKNSTSKLSKTEHKALEDLIMPMLKCIRAYLTPSEMDPELRSIMEDIEGVNFDKKISEGLSSLKEEIARFSNEQGIDIDLSELNEDDTQEEVMIKFTKAFQEAKESKTEAPREKAASRKKTKRELEKEQKAKELAEMQKKGLAGIYKQLAKAFHPDLELDEIVKKDKEELMKRLTTAYDNQDLHTLLILEIEWMNYSASTNNKDRILADQQLKIYNAVLKDQVESLKNQLDSLLDHPRYFELQYIIEEGYGLPILEALKHKEKELKNEIKFYSSTAHDLRGKSALKKLRKILKEYSSQSIALDAMYEFFDNFDIMD